MPLDEAYFKWLYSQVGSVTLRNRSKTYWALLRLLHKKEFTWSKKIDKDGNRAQDGMDLRRVFMRETNDVEIEDGWLELECSMLELLVALAKNLAFEIDGSVDGNTSLLFWDLIQNLGLTECTDANPPDERIVDGILDTVIYRQYSPNGAGGLFPLHKPDKDQRDVELWYQAQEYLLERY